MVEFISGNGLGLVNTSLDILGEQGGVGNSQVDRAGDKAYVNVVTGNLVVQRQDDFLSVLGQDISVARTYNSRGLADGDNNDGWRLGVVKGLSNYTGSYGSITRTDGDGSSSVYSYSSTLGKFVTNDGAGAYDSLQSYGGTTWIWTDGATQQTETYDWDSTTQVGKIVATSDTAGNTVTYQYQTYTPATSTTPIYLVKTLTAASGDRVDFAWGQGNLQSVTTTSGGVARQSVSYTYDAGNRLLAVNVAQAATGQWTDPVNVTTFEYNADGTMAAITGDDGSRTAFTYTNGKVTGVAQTVDGATRAVSITYNNDGSRFSPRQTTTISDVDGTTTFGFDYRTRRLMDITQPGGGTAYFAYDSYGNVLSQSDGRSGASYEYDEFGNQVTVATGVSTTYRTFSGRNELLTEMSYVGSTQTITRYAYDSRSNLRFIVSALGSLTEYRYDPQGRRIAEIVYAGTPAPSYTNEASLSAWAATQSPANTQLTEVAYDARGTVTQVKRYPAGGAQGTPEITQYTYDRNGLLLATTSAAGATTAYTYDSLGRVASSSNTDGFTAYLYDDAHNRVTVTRSDSSRVVSVYNAAGDLLSATTTGIAGTNATQSFAYDAKDRLRMTTDATGVRSYMLYDSDGHKVADIDNNGSLTEYAYRANGQPVSTTHYANALTAAQLASLVDANGKPANVTLASVRPAVNALDRTSWTLYDSTDRLVKTVSETGVVTEMSYWGKVLDHTTRYANPVSLAAVPSATQLSNSYFSPLVDTANDETTRYYYDDEGRLLAMLDPSGAVVENSYDTAGRLWKTVRYFAKTPCTDLPGAILAQVRPPVDTDGRDITTFYFHDGEGRVNGVLDGERFFTATAYDADGRVAEARRYASPTAIAAGSINSTTLASAVIPTGPAAITRYTYDGMGRELTRVDADGAVTTSTYDKLGRLQSRSLNAGTATASTTQYVLDDLGRVVTELTSGFGPVTYQYDPQGRRISEVDGNGKRTLFYYDADGRLAYTINPLGEVVADTYDNLGQVTQSRRYANRIAAAQLGTMTGGWAAAVSSTIAALANDAVDRRITYTYTADGRIAMSADETNTVTTAGYGTFGTTQYKTDENGNVTRCVYDIDERLVYELDATNAVVGYTYDNFGRVVKTTRYAQAVSTASIPANAKTPIALGTLATAVNAIADASRDVSSTNVYDENGRAVFTVSGAGAVTGRTFDALCNVIAEVRYARTITIPATLTVATVTQATALVANTAPDAATWSSYDAMGRLTYQADATGGVTTLAYNANGQLAERVVYANKTSTPSARSLPAGDPAHDSRVRSYYDTAGRLVRTATATGVQAGVLMWAISANAYDPAGNLVSTTDYATQQPDSQAAPSTSADDRVTRTVYDALGQALYRIDAEGAVTQSTYDSAGRVLQTRLYAARWTQAGNPDATALATLATNASDRLHRTVYDSAGHAVYTIDSFGAVTQYSYDAAGRVTQARQYAKKTSLSGNPTVAQMASLATSSADRVTRTVYDVDGRPTWTIDAQGAVTANSYDAQGRLIATREYAQTIDLATLPLGSAPDMTAVADAANDRFTQYAYDAEGRVIWRADAGGYLTQTSYDAQGRVLATSSYAVPMTVTAGVVATRTAMATWASAHPNPADKSTATAYDAAGRVASATDANGGTERFTYDGRGLRTSRTDKRGFTWTSGYDAAGRLVCERSPALDITQVTTGSSGEPVIGGQPAQSVETLSVYDAFGRVTSRTEANGTTQARTTTYQYDHMGRQVRTTFPDVQVYSDVSGGQLLTTKATPTAVVQYDAQGNALRNTAANNSVSYRVVDAEGRLAFEIDGMGYVTGYGRNVFGEVTSLTRFASKMTVAAGTLPSLSDMQTFAATGVHTDDRTIVTSYDLDGRVVKVIEPTAHYFDAATGTHNDAAKATTTTYNAFGDVLRQSVSGQLASGAVIGATDSTYFTWDVRGLQTTRIDVVDTRSGNALKGYLTTMTYDAAGRLIDRMEWGTALASLADANFNARTGMASTAPTADASDRRVKYAYDKNGNLLSETRVNVAYSTGSDGTQTTGDLATTYTYDAENHLVSTTDATGAMTVTSYDVMGRATAVATYSVGAKQRQIAQVYLALLGAPPTAQNIADGLTKTLLEVAQSIVGAANTKTATQFLTDLFSALVDRPADTQYLSEITAGNRAQFALTMIGRFTDAMNQDTAVLSARTTAALIISPTPSSMLLQWASTSEKRRLMIASLYAAILGRAPDADGMAFYMGNYYTDAQIVNAMLTSEEGTALYPTGTSGWEFAARLYQATQGEAADTTTVAAWAGQATDNRGAWAAFAAGKVKDLLTGPSSTALLSFTAKMMAGLPEGSDVYATPGTLSKFLLDAYGNVVQKIDYAAGALDGIDVFQATAGQDRVSYTQYDTSGHAVRQWDAQGNAKSIAYDIDGHAVAELRVGISNGQQQAIYEKHRYDALGRLVETRKPGEKAGDAEVIEGTTYNAFGEVTSRRVNGVEVEYADYDNAGHLWRGNAGDGVDKVFLYDAFGNRTEQLLDADTNLRSMQSITDIVTGSGLIETRYVYDLAGNVVTQKNPAQNTWDIGTNGATSGTTVTTAQAMSLTWTVKSQAERKPWRDGEGSETTIWQGTNTVHFDWASLGGLGAGDVRLEFSFFDADGKLVTQAANWRADVALTGQDMSWNDKAPMLSVQSVKLLKKTLAGDWQAIGTTSTSGTIGTMLRVDATALPDVPTTFEYHALGAGDWTSVALPRFGDAYVYDTTALAEGTYEYRVTTNGTVQDNGTFFVQNQRARERVARLYAGLLGRAAYASEVVTGVAPATLAATLYTSAEQGLSTMGTQGVINYLLTNTLRVLTPAVGGELATRVAAWTSQLGAATTVQDKGAKLLDILEQVAAYSGSDADMNAAHDLLAKKTAASLAYAVDDGGYKQLDYFIDGSGNKQPRVIEARAMMNELNTSGSLDAALAIGRDSLLRRQVTMLYVALLNRAPDSAGLAYQVNQVKAGNGLNLIADALLNSPEARGALLYWNANGTQVSDEQFISNIFQSTGRAASATDIAYWKSQLGSILQGQTTPVSRGQVAIDLLTAIAAYGGVDLTMIAARQLLNNKVSIGIAYAAEAGGSNPDVEKGLMAYATGAGTALASAQAAVAGFNAQVTAAQNAEVNTAILAGSAPMEENRRKIAELYAVILDRAPDAAGMQTYSDNMNWRGLSAEDTASAMLASPEGSPQYKDLSNVDFAKVMVGKVFARPATADEVTYWSNTLPGWSRAGMVCRMIERMYAEADASTLTARQLLSNKAAVGVMWSVDMASGNYDTATDKQLMLLTTATDTTAAVDLAVTTVANAAPKDGNAVFNNAQAACSKSITSADYWTQLAGYMTALDATNAIYPTAQSEQFTQIAQMYRGIFNRTAQYTELDFHFSNEFQIGMTQVQVADSFFQSPEGVTQYGGLTSDQIVTKIYQYMLSRTPDPAGMQTWTGELNAGQSKGKVFVDIVNGFLNYAGTDSTEYANKALFQQNVSSLLASCRTAATAAGYSKLSTLTLAATKEAADCTLYNADRLRNSALMMDNGTASPTGDGLTYTKVEQLYVGGLNRTGSLNELMFYTKQLADNIYFHTLDDVAQAFLNSAEGTAMYGALTNDAFIDRVYQNTFGRPVDPSGLTTWTAKFTQGQSRAQVMRGIIDSLVNYQGVGTNSSEMTRKGAYLRRVRDGILGATSDAFTYRNDPYGYYVQATSEGARQAAAVVDQEEIAPLNASTDAGNRKTVLQLYTLLFNAAPMQAAMNTWVGQMNAGSSTLQIATAMLGTDAGKAKYPPGMTGTAFVTAVFQSTLAKPPTAANLNAYPAGTLAQAAVTMVQQIAGYTGSVGADIEARLLLGNKVMQNAAVLQAGTHAATLTAQALATEATKVLGAANALADVVRKDGYVASATGGLQQAPAAPTVTRTYDRWGNLQSQTDPLSASWVTRYTYNALNEVLTVTDALNQTTQLYYDAAGHNVATKDARAKVNGLVYDAQGHVVEEIHADGATVQYRFNAFGDKTSQRGGDGVMTAFGYDRLGNVTSIARGGNVGVNVYSTQIGYNPGQVGSWNPADAAFVRRGVVTESYEYDAFGRRTGYTDASGYKSITYYDLRGNVMETRDALGQSTKYAHDAFDHTILKTYADGKTEQWSYDVAGRMAGHIDMRGGLTGYGYDAFTGRLISQKSTEYGQNLVFTYDPGSGLLVKIEDKSVAGREQITQYAYDLAGHRIREKTSTVDTTGKSWVETDVAQDNHIAYDTLGREVLVRDGRYDVAWTYDAANNRTSQHTRFRNTLEDGTEQFVDKTTWNSFDAMNREIVIDGVSANNGTTVTIGADLNNPQGQRVSYDGAGNRIHVTQAGKGLATAVIWGVTTPGTFSATGSNIVTSETSFYDAAGRLQTMYREGAIADARRYDAAGRLLETGQIGLDNVKADQLEAMGISAQTRLSAYDAGGELIQQAVMGQSWRTNGSTSEATVGYAYDAEGRVRMYDASMHKAGYARHYDYQYTDRDAHSVAKIEVHDVVPGSDPNYPTVQSPVLASTTNKYDANGFLTRVEGTDLKDTRDLVNDSQGRVLRKTQYTQQAGGLTGNTITTVARTTNTLIVNGEEIGSASSDKAVKDTFNRGYVQTGSLSGNTFYTVQSGDTLQGIAQAFWGNSNLWYLIADANGTSTITAGSVILIPPKPSTATDNSRVLKPYDPSKAIGDLTPTAPMPQGHHGGCGVMGQVLMIVVAVVATLYTAGALSGFTGSFLGTLQAGAGALGIAGAEAGAAAAGAFGAAGSTLGVPGIAMISAAAGSAASQLVGMATGNQHGFDPKQMVLSAVSAGLTSGLGGVDFQLGQTGNIAVRAAIANTMTQGIGVATGLQKNFNWNGVVASAAGAAIGQEVGTRIGDSFGGRLATSVIAGGTASAIRGGRITAQQVALDAFGNALGGSFAYSSSSSGQQSPLNEDAQAFLDAVNGFSAQGADRYPGVQVADYKAVGGNTVHTENVRLVDVDSDQRDSSLDGYVWPEGQQPAGTVLGYRDKVGPYFRTYQDGGVQYVLPGGAQATLDRVEITASRSQLADEYVPFEDGFPGPIAQSPLLPDWNMLDASRQSFERERHARIANSPSMTEWVPGPSVVDRLNQTAATIESISRNPGGAAGYIAGRSLGMRPQDAAAMAAIGATTGELLSLRAGARTGKNTDVEGYMSGLYRKTTPTGTPAGLFEVEQTGSYNYRVVGGGTAIDIDGYRGQTILEAKHIGDVSRSPYVPNSNIPSFLRDKILKEQQHEFQRMQSVINDPTVPFTRVEVLTNHNDAVPYFRELMDRYQVPGVVRVVPTQVPPTWPRNP